MGRRSFFRRNKQKNDNNAEDFSVKIVNQLDENVENLKKMLDEPDDLIIRVMAIPDTMYKGAVVYISGLVDSDIIHNSVIKDLRRPLGDKGNASPKELLNSIYLDVISVSDINIGKTLDEVSLAILSGSTVFYLDGIDKVLIIGTTGGESRSIEEPVTEGLIRGPRNGFVENIRTNTALIRRYIQEPNLRFKTHKIGRRARKNLVVTYIDGIINPDILKEVNRRLETIDIDEAPESGYIEQWIEDSFLSPFPQVINTERPDKVAAALLDGKVAILLDGTPFVLIAPATLGNSLQSPEDYYDRWTIGTLLRGLRYVAAFIAVFLPALYIALVSYHQGMIPSALAFSIAGTREGVPFPAFVEAFLMTVTMELLREAGTRLPKPIGQTIGIVGGLVIGEAAVTAGLVSPVMVIVVALNAIASFSLPSYSIAIAFRIIMFGLIFAAGVFGLYGIILCYIMLNIHIVNLKSFGVPYSTPFAPAFIKDWKDLVLRAPIPMLKNRPQHMQTMDDDRTGNKGD
ncbi:spore germination protein [Oceanobacillus picturae]|uniref:spore germination protein n=1 Tax=Oceanobacillus picturae TaxID=171693 RepID=UPI00362AE0AF